MEKRLPIASNCWEVKELLRSSWTAYVQLVVRRMFILSTFQFSERVKRFGPGMDTYWIRTLSWKVGVFFISFKGSISKKSWYLKVRQPPSGRCCFEPPQGFSQLCHGTRCVALELLTALASPGTPQPWTFMVQVGAWTACRHADADAMTHAWIMYG